MSCRFSGPQSPAAIRRYCTTMLRVPQQSAQTSAMSVLYGYGLPHVGHRAQRIMSAASGRNVVDDLDCLTELWIPQSHVSLKRLPYCYMRAVTPPIVHIRNAHVPGRTTVHHIHTIHTLVQQQQSLEHTYHRMSDESVRRSLSPSLQRMSSRDSCPRTESCGYIVSCHVLQ